MHLESHELANLGQSQSSLCMHAKEIIIMTVSHLGVDHLSPHYDKWIENEKMDRSVDKNRNLGGE